MAVDIKTENVCQVLKEEFLEESKIRGEKVPIIELVAKKTQQMTEYF